MGTSKTTPRDRDVDVAALMHALEVRQAELELQNLELTTINAELQRSNSALATARDRLRLLYELAPTALVSIGADRQVVDVNRAAEDLFRAPRGQLTERPLALFFAESVRQPLRTWLTRLFDTEGAAAGELVSTLEGSEPLEVRVDGKVFHDESGTDAVLAFVDLTARKRAEEERRTLEREVLDAHRLESLGVLAGGIAHDFNNLLTVVLGGTDLVLRTLAGSPAIEPLIQVRQAALHAGELAHQMLAYTGLASSSPRPLDLGALVREVEALIAAAAGTTPVSLDLPDTGRWVSGDATQLRQVVLNLVINAAEATAGRAGSIALSVRSDGASVVLAVADSGVGMDAATQERIFEPYYSTKFVGRGLGLAVVQGIVRGHKGTLTVESEIGRGTTMRVHLPGMRPAEETRRTESIARWRRSGTVLLVDDDRPVRTAIERILVELGFEVLVAGDGVEAIEIFRTEGERVDLVLMDHAMPRMNGPTAAAAIHGVRAEVPIVLVTGYAEVPADAGGVFSGMLSKPFDIAALEQLLARFST